MEKIKGKSFGTMILLLVALLLFYTRFINLSWGLPFPFHPDERNMAVALQQLDCRHFSNCFNPHFFAYGQFPLYVGYLLWLLGRLGRWGEVMSFSEAVLILRLISAVASVATFFVMVKIVELITYRFSLSSRPKWRDPLKQRDSSANARNDNEKDSGVTLFPRMTWETLIVSLIFIFSPALIQFAHFGTTESLLMFFYINTIYLVLLFLNKIISSRSFIIVTAIVAGLALGTKVSAAIFLLLPAVIIVRKIKGLIVFLLLTAVVGIISSPYNLISVNDFLSSMKYESAIAAGNIMVFYTRQFFETVPVLFQFTNIFPYVLGLPVLILFILGFFFLPRNKNYNILRLAFLIYFIPSAFFYTKWTRFMAPVFPVMLVIAVLFLIVACNYLQRHSGKRSANWRRARPESVSRTIDSGVVTSFLPRMTLNFVFFILIFPGVAYLSIYRNEDVRVKASKWIYENIPPGSNILSESGNVVNIPLPSLKQDSRDYHVNYFDFYVLDQEHNFNNQLADALSKTEYVIVPSRRVVMNTTCKVQRFVQGTISLWLTPFTVQDKKRCQDLQKKYPLTNSYYNELLSKQFKKIAEFDSYPKISLFNKTLFESKDEQSEETWSVFDHPVIRIYKKQ